MITCPLWLAITISVFLYISCPIFLAAIFNKKNVISISIILFLLFIVALYLGVFTNFSKDSNNVYIEFDYSGKWFSKQIDFNIFKISKFDFIVNLVMLIPIGACIMLWKKKRNNLCKNWKILVFSLLLGLLVGLFIETMQFILPISRAVQISDVLLNGVSCLIGTIYMLILLKIFKKS